MAACNVDKMNQIQMPELSLNPPLSLPLPLSLSLTTPEALFVLLNGGQVGKEFIEERPSCFSLRG